MRGRLYYGSQLAQLQGNAATRLCCGRQTVVAVGHRCRLAARDRTTALHRMKGKTMPKTEPASDEQAVRDYLLLISEPDALLDHKAIMSARSKLEQASDPLERVALRAEVDALETPDVEGIEAAFVQHAKGWADVNGVQAGAFLAEGVESKVLRRAGFQVSTGAGNGQQRRTGGKRASIEDAAKTLRKLSGRFTVAEVAERSGASQATARKAVQAAVKAGDVVEVGADEAHEGPGRAPTVYTTV